MGLRFCVLLNSISIISVRWVGDNCWLCAMEPWEFEKRGSNPEPLYQQASALPIELTRFLQERSSCACVWGGGGQGRGGGAGDCRRLCLF